MKPGYNSSRLWYLWLVVTWCTSIQTWVNAVRECEDFPRWPPRSQGTLGVPAEREMSWKVPSETGYLRWMSMYPVYSIFKTGSAADATVKPGVLGRNLRVWLLFSPLKQNLRYRLYLTITLVIRLATRSGAHAPHRFYWWLIWKLNSLVVAIIEFYAFQRLFIRTKFLEVVDGLMSLPS